MKDIKLSKYGVNAKIKATILSDTKMKEVGFTDCNKDTWYFCRPIKFVNNKRYKWFEITFNVSIKKDNPEDLRIDILDEDFLQPFDYQEMLLNNPDFEIALSVKEQVEEWMQHLSGCGVLSGHEYGEYI